MADLVGAIVAPPVKHRPAITDKREFGAFLRDLRGVKEADPLTLLATRLGWGATLILSGGTTSMMAGGEESEAA